MHPKTSEKGKRTLYQVVIDDILEQIAGGAFSFDKPICTESKLMEDYGISRITARRAMTELENQGVLYRKRGVGSFVSRDIYAQQQPESTSKLFAFIFPFNPSRSGLNTAFQAANHMLIQGGYAASIYITEDTDEARGRTFLHQLAQMDVAGVAYYPKTSDAHLLLLNQLLFQGKSVVIMDLPDKCRYISSVSSDNFSGSTQLMEHLLDLGHQRIAYLAGISPDARSTVADRMAGYVLSLEKAGLPIDDELIVTDMTENARRQTSGRGGQTALQSTIQRLFARGATAILCEHDQLAFETVIACKELGISVPSQLSVCGFDNSEWAKILPDGITTVEQDMEKMGIETAKLLLSGLTSPMSAARQVVLPTHLVPGATTGPAPSTTTANGEEST